MTRKQWIVIAGVLVVGMVVGGISGVFWISEYRAYRQAQATLVDVVRLLNYNLQVGALKGLPAQPAGPQATPAPRPAPPSPEK